MAGIVDRSANSPIQTQLSHADDGDSTARSGTDTRRVLWIDDVVDNICVRLLDLEGFKTDCASTGSSGLARARSQRYDAYIIDLQLPDMYGLTVLERLVAEGSQAPALVLTGCYTEHESETLARQLGAADFRCKPIAAGDLALTLKFMTAKPHLTAGSERRARAVPACTPEPRFAIVAVSAAMQSVLEWVDRVGPTTMPALITGETGTGKELVARALHEHSDRRAHTFLAINCSAFLEGLLETELFGHRRGAFTGAFQDKKGLLEEAANGTV
ncbi:MAG: sigma-54-dependent Fis family transcriptional regulator, partial [Acidobacteria bacterium]|nr:sigma-54-dependent Fis family transcriptional regulator [Acidobacteriota bacterium]